MSKGYHEPGDDCAQEGCDGHLEAGEAENCSCHISPPCSACVNAPLECVECGFQPEE